MITTLLDNHYHSLGHLAIGENLGPMMQKLRGSVAKLVNDLLPARHLPFWRTAGNHDYFDGCIRDAVQLRRAYRYTQNQAIRAGFARCFRDYPHTVVNRSLDDALAFAERRQAYLATVPYARYG